MLFLACCHALMLQLLQSRNACLCAGNTASVANGSALDPAGRKPPLFISLSAIRQARKSASALMYESALVVESQARTKPKSKLGVATPGAAQAAAAQPAGPKQKCVLS